MTSLDRLLTIRIALTRWIITHPTGRWVFFGGCVGLLCGLATAAFEIATDLVAKAFLENIAGLPQLIAASHPGNLSLDATPSWLLLLAVMGAGGLVAGLIITRWSKHARGGGTGVAVHAYHHERGTIPLITPWTKFAASIISLGSGGSGGREGPISLIGAGFGSWFAGRMGLTARDRRILLAAGIAGGIAAVFRAPLAAAIFAAEVLYRGPDLESDVLIPAFIAAVVGYLVGTIGLEVLGPLVGHQAALASTLFQPPQVGFRVGDWMHLGGYTLVALACAMISRWFIAVQHGAVKRFNDLALPFWAKPALGALGAGLVAIALLMLAGVILGSHQEARITLGVIGSGYGVMHWLFAAHADEHHHLIIAGLLASIALCKAVTTALTVGSGGSAGLFGPSIVIGGCTGGAIGYALIGLPIAPSPAACVMMGMAGVLAATHRTPVAALLMVSEIAGTWLLLMPAMWVCGLAFLLTGRRSLISGQVDGISDSPAHRSHLFKDVLANAFVRDLLLDGRNWQTIAAKSSISECRNIIQETYQDHFPVVRQDGRLVGMLDRLEIVRLQPDPDLDGLVVADDLAGGAGMALRPDDTLTIALRRFHQQRVEELPVIDAAGCYVGMVCSGQVMGCYRTALDRVAAEQSDEGLSALDQLRRDSTASSRTATR
jgi:chloride channel protein, CIC family